MSDRIRYGHSLVDCESASNFEGAWRSARSKLHHVNVTVPAEREAAARRFCGEVIGLSGEE